MYARDCDGVGGIEVRRSTGAPPIPDLPLRARTPAAAGHPSHGKHPPSSPLPSPPIRSPAFLDPWRPPPASAPEPITTGRTARIRCDYRHWPRLASVVVPTPIGR